MYNACPATKLNYVTTSIKFLHFVAYRFLNEICSRDIGTSVTIQLLVSLYTPTLGDIPPKKKRLRHPASTYGAISIERKYILIKYFMYYYMIKSITRSDKVEEYVQFFKC